MRLLVTIICFLIVPYFLTGWSQSVAKFMQPENFFFFSSIPWGAWAFISYTLTRWAANFPETRRRLEMDVTLKNIHDIYNLKK